VNYIVSVLYLWCKQRFFSWIVSLELRLELSWKCKLLIRLIIIYLLYMLCILWSLFIRCAIIRLGSCLTVKRNYILLALYLWKLPSFTFFAVWHKNVWVSALRSKWHLIYERLWSFFNINPLYFPIKVWVLYNDLQHSLFIQEILLLRLLAVLP